MDHPQPVARLALATGSIELVAERELELVAERGPELELATGRALELELATGRALELELATEQVELAAESAHALAGGSVSHSLARN